MKVCTLYMAKPVVILYLLMAVAGPCIGALGIVVAAYGAFGPGTEGTCVTIFLIVLGIGLVVSYSWVRFPFEISIDKEAMTFRSLVRRTVIPVSEIRSVRAKPYTLGFVDVRHGRGTVHLISQMDGFHEFVGTVKLLNPAAKIEGC